MFPSRLSLTSLYAMLNQVKAFLRSLPQTPEFSTEAYRQGQTLYLNGQCQMLSQGHDRFEVLIDDEFGDYFLTLYVQDEQVRYETQGERETQVAHLVAGLLHVIEELERGEAREIPAGKVYTREGMIRRVLAERAEKARKAHYKIAFAENPYGEHRLTNEQGVPYKLTFHDLPAETGYCSCPDYRTNKLGTCKHLMYAYMVKKGDKERLRPPRKPFPFVEVGLDPARDYQIRWFHPMPQEIAPEVRALLRKYFGEDTHLPEDPTRIRQLLHFLREAEAHKQILIRPELHERIERSYTELMLERVGLNHEMDLSGLKATLYPYQRRGVEFAAFREAVIIADEMGLGKTLQAIATALVKKAAFGFTRTLIICPASLKDQWKQEIEKFTEEEAVVVSGRPEEREALYRESQAYFLILNYETVLRDRRAINHSDPDFIILDEAQRIKNFETATARSIKQLRKKHALVITGTPIENRLVDLFSIMDFLDPYFLAPLWEFSYQHCFFDHDQKNKITGYYNLQSLKERLQPILLRRTKREVIEELPNLTQIDIPVALHPDQAEMHAGFAAGISAILRKKFITPYDMNRLMMLLNQMRMVCNSTFLIDQETNVSPKLEELRDILLEKLDLKESDRKVLIFSEWVRMHGLIGKLLREIGIPFVELNGKVPVAKRQALVDKFNSDPTVKVFLSTEAGGAGLNLQVADTVINFELPWNPAKKNQRIGRIDRLGQEADQLTVINLITRDSIEMRLATGLMLKQNLFESVLDTDVYSDMVDFSEQGRAQFLKELTSIIGEMTEGRAVEDQEEETFPSAIRELAEEFVPEETSPEPEAAPEVVPQRRDGATRPPAPQPEEMAQVLNQGMSFLAGLFKMATGQDMGTEGQRIEIDEASGEVVMRFRMPGLGHSHD